MSYVVAKPFNSQTRRFMVTAPPMSVSTSDVVPLDFETLKARGFIIEAKSASPAPLTKQRYDRAAKSEAVD